LSPHLVQLLRHFRLHRLAHRQRTFCIVLVIIFFQTVFFQAEGGRGWRRRRRGWRITEAVTFII
jgi:hypothetical protein